MTRVKLSALLTIFVLLIGLAAPSVQADPGVGGSLLNSAAASQADDGSDPSLRLTASTSEGVEFEVSVDADGLVVEEVEAGGRVYSKVSLPGWAETFAEGMPVLPVELAQLGVPFGAEVVVEVTPGEARVVALSAPVLPGVKTVAKWGLPGEDETGPLMPEMVEVYEEDAAVYGGGVYPGVLAEVSGDGVMRQQRVVGVSAYPVQYDAGAQELLVYETLRVSVRFVGGMSADGFGGSEESEAYEQVLSQQLLNYEEARGYRESVGGLEQLPVESAVQGMEVNEVGGWTPPDPGWRVKVQEDGLYRLTYEELEAAGLPVASLDTSKLQMFHLGVEVAIWVELGSDLVFNAGDYVVFYGEAIDSKYTRDNVYWLTYGNATGLRMADRNGTPSTAAIPETYPVYRQLEGGGYYLSDLPVTSDVEHFLWGRLYTRDTTTWTTTFDQAVSGTADITMTTKFRGAFNNPSVNPDHHVRVSINGTLIGETLFDGVGWHTAQFTIPAGLLLNSPEVNTLVFTDPNDLGAGLVLEYIDWIELEYANTFVANNNGLAFKYIEPGTWKYQVSGYTTDQVQVYDVTDPSTPVRINDTTISGSDPYTLEFEDTIAAETRYWAGADSALKSVTTIEMDTAFDLLSTENGEDYIVITHTDFTTAASALADFRDANGLRALAVDVQDVYDEFSFGLVDPVGIRDFLAYAYANWVSPAPSYVVLMGDGNYDPKNYLLKNRTNYIPPYLLNVDPWIGETAADNRYVTISGADTMPDMMLGRFAVNSLAEAQAMVDKVIAYETALPTGDWRQQVLAVTDNADLGGPYPLLSDNLISCCIPSSYTVQKIYYNGSTADADKIAARNAILAAYGKFIVNYIGHGYTNGWASESLLTSASIASLTNSGQQPIVLPMTCMEGYYIHPDPSLPTTSLAETTTRAAGKGAIASWSATGQGVASGHDYLNRGFLTALLTNGVSTLGQATQAGKQYLFSLNASPDLLDTYTLFGDPALRMPVSVTTITSHNPNPSAVNSPYTVAVEVEGNYATPSGTVNVSDGTGAICNITLDENGIGSCNLTSTTPGLKTITATYPNDGVNNGSVGKAQHFVKAASTTVITGDAPDPSPQYAAYTVSVTVSGAYGAPAGTVSISDGAGASCNATLTGGSGSCALTSTVSGPKSISASYAGDANYYGSDAESETHDVTPVYSLSGIILDYLNVPIAGVSISNGAGGTVVTDSSGVFTFTSLIEGNYTITPNLLGFDFSPVSREVTISDANVTGIDFTGSQLGPLHTVSGTVVDALSVPLSGVTIVDNYARTAVTNASGVYNFPGFPAGTYTLEARLAGYAFAPASAEVTVVDADLAGVDFSGTAYTFPVLVSPANKTKTNNNDVELVWKAVKDTVYYKVLISKDELFTTKIKALVYPQGGELQLMHLLEDFPDGKYYWKVKAFYAGDAKSPWSEVRIFKVDTVPPAVPKLYKPVNNKYKADFTPTFTIYPATGAKYYHYQVAADAAFTAIVAESNELAGLTWTVPDENALAYGEYFWRVMAIDAAGNVSNWSDPWRLLISFQKLPKYGAVTTDKTPTFEWLTVANAENYRLEISQTDEGMVDDRFITGLAGLTLYTIPKVEKLSVGNYQWRMVAVIGGEEFFTPWSVLVIIAP